MNFKKSKGLTLLEVIISLAILGIIIAPILTMTLTTVKVSKSSEEKILATSLAQQCTEYIKNEDINLLDFSKIGLVENNEEKLKELMKNENGTIIPFKLYTLSGNSQNKNIIAKIYKIDNEIITNEDSEDSNYDMIITVEENDKISIMDTRNKSTVASADKFSNNGRSIIQVINDKDTIICTVKQGESELISSRVINKKINNNGKVKVIFKSSNNINVDIYAKNTEEKDNKLSLKMLKMSNSQYHYTVIENDGVNSDNIIEQYEILDMSKKDPNKLMKKCLFNIDIFYYNSKTNTKTLMQQVKTYKAL